MNKKIRKKWLKRHGKYVSENDIYNLDINICKFIIPKLKKFRDETISTPLKIRDNYGEHEILDKNEEHNLKFLTLDEWKEIINEMITSFEMILDDSWDEEAYDGGSKAINDYWNGKIKEHPNFNMEKFKELSKQRNKVIKNGLNLFY